MDKLNGPNAAGILQWGQAECREEAVRLVEKAKGMSQGSRHGQVAQVGNTTIYTS